MSQPVHVKRLDTEPRFKALQLGSGVYGTLLERRDALRRDIRQVSCILLDDFVDTVLPQSYKAAFPSLDGITEHLKSGPEPALDSRGYWSKFPELPHKSKDVEVKLFKSLEDIISAISEAIDVLDPVPAEDTRVVEYLNNGYRTPESMHRDNSSRPDGFFVLKNSRPSAPETAGKGAKPPVARWWDIAVNAEFKKDLKDLGIRDDVDKMLWGFHHILCEDPCRNFVYGFTIERTSTRLWYCDRSNIVVSDVFDLHKDSSTFLRFCVSILCASREELGWDLTTQRIETPGAEVHYIIDVRAEGDVVRQFITTSIISATGAEGILGRGTRVWEAIEKPRDGEQAAEKAVPVVLKDYWIDDDRIREGVIYESILKGVKGEDRENLKKYLVKIKYHGDVYRRNVVVGSREGKTTMVFQMVPTSTRDLDAAIKKRNGAIVLHKPTTEASKAPTQDTRAYSGTLTPVTPSAYFDAIVRTPLAILPSVKTRNRIVMQQVGESLHRQKSLRIVFKALADVCKGLQLVHLSGWVHRDISSGNIIVYKGRGYLTDFEYAKKASSSAKLHDGRTGTPYFMPIEVQAGHYLFLRAQRKTLRVRKISDSRKGNTSDPEPSSAPDSPASSPAVRSTSQSLANPSAPPSAPPTGPPSPTSAVPSSPSSSLADEEPILGKRRRGRQSTTADGAEPGDVAIRSPRVVVPPKSPPPLSQYSFFSYNPLHDFESVIWICLYFIVDRIVVDHTQQQSPDDLELQRQDARAIFSGLAAPRQHLYFTLRYGKDAYIDEIISRLHPAVHGIGWAIKEMVERLRWAYELVGEEEDGVNIARSDIALSFGDNIEESLEQVINILSEGDVECAPFPVTSTDDGEKQAAVDEGESEPSSEIAATTATNDAGPETMVQSLESGRPATKKIRTGSTVAARRK